VKIDLGRGAYLEPDEGRALCAKRRDLEEQ
jgi:hypothetical protein